MSDSPMKVDELCDELEVFFHEDAIVKTEDQHGNLISVKRLRPDQDGRGRMIVVLETRKL